MADIRLIRRKYVTTITSESEAGRKWMEQRFINPLPTPNMQLQNLQHEYAEEILEELLHDGLTVDE